MKGAVHNLAVPFLIPKDYTTINQESNKTILYILVCFLTLTSLKHPKKTIGNWNIFAIEIERKQIDKLPLDWIAFKADGIIELGVSGKMIFGIWIFR